MAPIIGYTLAATLGLVLWVLPFFNLALWWRLVLVLVIAVVATGWFSSVRPPEGRDP